MNLRTLWLAVALGASPLVANAQISAGVSFNWSTSAPGDSVDSVDVFYDQLSPYGVWIDDPTVGQAFIPDQDNYVPYQNGHWENTDVGFVWISDEPFAWATSHYGRWWFSNDYGRWVWVPDTTWGPSWVDWYETDDSFGWAPLAPAAVIDIGYTVPLSAYHYCPAEHILDTDVTRYYEPSSRVEMIQRQARPVSSRIHMGTHEVVAGPQPQRLAAHRINTQPRKVNVKTLGRMQPTELRAATQRAQQRKPQIEQQNAKRLQAHTEIDKVVKERASKAPARPNTHGTEATPNERLNNRVNGVDRTKETNPATPNAATPRPDVNRTENGTPVREPNKTPDRTDQNRTNKTNRPEPNMKTPDRTEPNRPNMKTPDRTEPNMKTPDRTEPTNRPHPNATTPRPEPTRTVTPRPEPQRAEPTRPEPTPRPEPQRAEPPRPEPQRAEPPRPEPMTSRPEPQRAEPPRPEPQAMPRPQATRPEPPRAEPPRAEPPRPEPMHAEPPRAEPSHAAPPVHSAPPPSHGKNDKRKD